MTNSPADPDDHAVASDEDTTDEDTMAGDAAPGDASTEEKPWWDNPAFPWQGKPTKADLGCLWAITGMGIYGLAMLPIRPVVLSLNPYISGAINGGSVSMAFIGASTAAEPTWLWILGLLIGTISLIKFDWIFWWAGRLWGDRLIDYLLNGRGKMAKANARRAQRLTHKYDILAMTLTYVPFIPFPSAIVYGALGIARTSLRKFLAIDLTLSFLTRCLYMYLGYRIGQPAVDMLEKFGKYSWYLAIALIVVVIGMMIFRSGRKKANAG